jgi:multiple sugar transport system substrate-binding protein
MSKAAAENYLGAIRDSLQSPNMILDLRIPKSAQYEGVVLDTALAQFLAGEIGRDDTMKQIQSGWEKITNDQGRDKQKQAYAASLNIQR